MDKVKDWTEDWTGMRSFRTWLLAVLLVPIFYLLSLGPVAVSAFRYRGHLGHLWPVYRIYIEPVHACPGEVGRAGENYLRWWCKITNTQWPGDMTLD